jgi:hypothetical protein
VFVGSEGWCVVAISSTVASIGSIDRYSGGLYRRSISGAHVDANTKKKQARQVRKQKPVTRSTVQHQTHMPRKAQAPNGAAGGDVLSLNELGWVRTLDVDARAFDIEASPTSEWVTAPSSPSSPWASAPSSPTWPSMPAMPQLSKKEAKRVRNRRYSKIVRQRKLAYEQAVRARIAEIEQVNRELQEQLEKELEKNAALRRSIGMEEHMFESGM